MAKKNVVQTGIRGLFSNPAKLFLLAAAAYLLVQGLNIILNMLGVELNFFTSTLDFILNFGSQIIAVLFIVSIAVYFYNRLRR